MSVSAIFGTRMVVTLPKTTPGFGGGATKAFPGVGSTGLVIECSSRPTKKATAHHRKTRPRKTQPWDIRRKPAVYPPLPALPPEWSFAPADEATDEGAAEAPAQATESE